MSIDNAKAGEIWGYTTELLNSENPTGTLIKTEINVYVRENKNGLISGHNIGEDSAPITIKIPSTEGWRKKSICEDTGSGGSGGQWRLSQAKHQERSQAKHQEKHQERSQQKQWRHKTQLQAINMNRMSSPCCFHRHSIQVLGSLDEG